MKNITKLSLLVLAVSLLPLVSQAQFKRVGVKGGVNISSARITNPDFSTLVGKTELGSAIGYSFGFLSQTSSNDIFLTDFGIFYSLKGYKEPDFDLKMHYLQVPLVFKIRIPIAGPVALQGGFGPYVSYAFLAKETENSASNEDILSIRRKNKGGFITTGDLKPYNPFDAGMIFGGDVEVKLPNNNFILIGFNYELGVAKFSNEWSLSPEIDDSFFNPGLKNNNMNINISYLFDVTSKSE